MGQYRNPFIRGWAKGYPRYQQNLTLLLAYFTKFGGTLHPIKKLKHRAFFNRKPHNIVGHMAYVLRYKAHMMDRGISMYHFIQEKTGLSLKEISFLQDSQDNMDKILAFFTRKVYENTAAG